MTHSADEGVKGTHQTILTGSAFIGGINYSIIVKYHVLLFRLVAHD